MSDVVDCLEAIEVFKEVADSQSELRMCVITAGKGRGKSALIRKLHSVGEWELEAHVALVDLADVTEPNIYRLVLVIRERLDKLDFPRFDNLHQILRDKDVAAFVKLEKGASGDASGHHGEVNAAGATVSDGGQIGGIIENREIHVAPGAVYHEAAAQAAREWTSGLEHDAQKEAVRSFLDDLRAVSDPTMIFLDSVDELTNKTLREWVQRELTKELVLGKNPLPPNVVLVVAGRDLPDYRDLAGKSRFDGRARTIDDLGQWAVEDVLEFFKLLGGELSSTDLEVQLLHKRIGDGAGIDVAKQLAIQMLDLRK